MSICRESGCGAGTGTPLCPTKGWIRCANYCREHGLKGLRRRPLTNLDDIVGADLAVDVLTCAGGHRHVVHRGQRLRGDTRNGVRMCWACWMGWTPGGRAWLGEWDRHQGWEAYARAHHNVLGQGRKYDSSIWYRHLACGKVVPKWQHDPGKGWPPYCIGCDDGSCSRPTGRSRMTRQTCCIW
jgi:hypothetical protein